MREKLNSDPKTQLIAVGVLILAAAFFLISTMGGKKSDAAPPPATTATTATTDPAAATTDPAAVAAAPTIDPTTGLPVTTSTTSAALPDVPAPPLPQDVANAVKANKTVALLIIQPAAVDDKLVAQSVNQLNENHVANFVVDVKNIAQYAAITQGVNVDRTPALVIVRPKNLTGGSPTATVSYSFQSKEAVDQAVRDATYTGPDTTYAPR